MDNNSDNKAKTSPSTALITGAGKRIGRALALHLGAKGYAVGLHYNTSEKEAQSVAADIRRSGANAVCLHADFSDPEEVTQLIGQTNKALGPLTLLINCASVFTYDDIDSLTRESWTTHLEANLWAPLKLSQDFARQAERMHQPMILNIIDQRVLKLTPQFLSYTTTKAALWTLTQTLAQALGPSGLRVNAIGPGPVLKNPRQSEQDWHRQTNATILGRGADPGDICAAADYLIGAYNVTGQMITVDGGQHLVWQTPDTMGKG